MSEMYLHISTPYGNRYTIDSQGRFSRDDLHSPFSDTWILKGIAHVRNTTFRIPLDELFKPGCIESLNLLYKNGHPQYTVIDIDHGTTRLWGNTKYHGIYRMWLSKKGIES